MRLAKVNLGIDNEEWHNWFAWYPVWVGNDLLWLEHIRRRYSYNEEKYIYESWEQD